MTAVQIIILLAMGFLLICLIAIAGSLYFSMNNLPVIDILSTKTPLPTFVPIDVYITLSIDLVIEDAPVVVGQTNLLDGTIIMVTMQGDDNSFVGQDKVYVKNGAFRSAAFSLPTAPYNIGLYTVEALMPYTHVQPESVRRIIGENGEGLSGHLLIRDASGTYVQTEAGFEIRPKVMELFGLEMGKRKIGLADTDFAYAITLKRAYWTNRPLAKVTI